MDESKQIVAEEVLDRIKTRKVTCKICSRRRDLYYVGSDIYCIDHTISHLVSLID